MKKESWKLILVQFPPQKSLPRLSLWQKILLFFKKRFQKSATKRPSRGLPFLLEALKKNYGEEVLENYRFENQEGQKPKIKIKIKNQAVPFNFSHSGNFLAISLFLPSAEKILIQKPKFFQKLKQNALRFFSPSLNNKEGMDNEQKDQDFLGVDIEKIKPRKFLNAISLRYWKGAPPLLSPFLPNGFEKKYKLSQKQCAVLDFYCAWSLGEAWIKSEGTASWKGKKPTWQWQKGNSIDFWSEISDWADFLSSKNEGWLKRILKKSNPQVMLNQILSPATKGVFSFLPLVKQTLQILDRGLSAKNAFFFLAGAGFDYLVSQQVVKNKPLGAVSEKEGSFPSSLKNSGVEKKHFQLFFLGVDAENQIYSLALVIPKFIVQKNIPLVVENQSELKLIYCCVFSA